MKKIGKLIGSSLLALGLLFSVTACSTGNYLGVLNTYTGTADSFGYKAEKSSTVTEVATADFSDIKASYIKESESDVLEFEYTITVKNSETIEVGSQKTTTTVENKKTITYKSPIYKDGKKIYIKYTGPKLVEEKHEVESNGEKTTVVTKTIDEVSQKIALTIEKNSISFELPFSTKVWNKDKKVLEDDVVAVKFAFTKE